MPNRSRGGLVCAPYCHDAERKRESSHHSAIGAGRRRRRVLRKALPPLVEDEMTLDEIM